VEPDLDWSMDACDHNLYLLQSPDRLRCAGEECVLLLILPIFLSISLFLSADIDSPRRGIILVVPQNLESLAEPLHSQ
jgi:hypothetical protein